MRHLQHVAQSGGVQWQLLTCSCRHHERIRRCRRLIAAPESQSTWLAMLTTKVSQKNQPAKFNLSETLSGGGGGEGGGEGEKGGGGGREGGGSCVSTRAFSTLSMNCKLKNLDRLFRRAFHDWHLCDRQNLLDGEH